MVYTTYKRGDYLELASVSVVCKAWLGAWRKYSRWFRPLFYQLQLPGLLLSLSSPRSV